MVVGCRATVAVGGCIDASSVISNYATCKLKAGQYKCGHGQAFKPV